jgi:hypothetical protein
MTEQVEPQVQREKPERKCADRALLGAFSISHWSKYCIDYFLETLGAGWAGLNQHPPMHHSLDACNHLIMGDHH